MTPIMTVTAFDVPRKATFDQTRLTLVGAALIQANMLKTWLQRCGWNSEQHAMRQYCVSKSHRERKCTSASVQALKHAWVERVEQVFIGGN